MTTRVRLLLFPYVLVRRDVAGIERKRNDDMNGTKGIETTAIIAFALVEPYSVTYAVIVTPDFKDTLSFLKFPFTIYLNNGACPVSADETSPFPFFPFCLLIFFSTQQQSHISSFSTDIHIIMSFLSSYDRTCCCMLDDDWTLIDNERNDSQLPIWKIFCCCSSFRLGFLALSSLSLTDWYSEPLCSHFLFFPLSSWHPFHTTSLSLISFLFLDSLVSFFLFSPLTLMNECICSVTTVEELMENGLWWPTLDGTRDEMKWWNEPERAGVLGWELYLLPR